MNLISMEMILIYTSIKQQNIYHYDNLLGIILGDFFFITLMNINYSIKTITLHLLLIKFQIKKNYNQTIIKKNSETYYENYKKPQRFK